ncbi:MAG: ATP synthase subunit I [Planctomycetaceae bacterium]|nr:ATP synthase subunit I [Planctomycetaceae bacterium]
MEMAWPVLLFCGVAGVLLGVFYFGSLWWVVRRLPEMSRPSIWFPISSILRTLVVLAGVYFLMGGRWERLVALMVGFIIGRIVVFRKVGISPHRSPNA